MTDFSVCRKNMVDCQLATNGIACPELLNIYRSLPREKFLPSKHAALAYIDEDLQLGQAGLFLEPMIEAKMLQAANIDKKDVVLVLGGGAAPLAAVASHLAQTVFVKDASKTLIKNISKVFLDESMGNVVCDAGDVCGGSPDHAPYDVIFIGGACCDLSDTLFAQVKDGGCLIMPYRPDSSQPAELVKYTKQGTELVKTIICQSNTPYLKGFSLEKGFVF